MVIVNPLTVLLRLFSESKVLLALAAIFVDVTSSNLADKWKQVDGVLYLKSQHDLNLKVFSVKRMIWLNTYFVCYKTVSVWKKYIHLKRKSVHLLILRHLYASVLAKLVRK